MASERQQNSLDFDEVDEPTKKRSSLMLNYDVAEKRAKRTRYSHIQKSKEEPLKNSDTQLLVSQLDLKNLRLLLWDLLERNGKRFETQVRLWIERQQSGKSGGDELDASLSSSDESVKLHVDFASGKSVSSSSSSKASATLAPKRTPIKRLRKLASPTNSIDVDTPSTPTPSVQTPTRVSTTSKSPLTTPQRTKAGVPIRRLTPARLLSTSPGKVRQKSPKSVFKHRPRQAWSEEEIENLKMGHEMYGNDWAKILTMYEFNQRTNVDLKDKWRNILRANEEK